MNICDLSIKATISNAKLTIFSAIYITIIVILKINSENL